MFFKGTISLLQNLSGNEDLYKIQNETRSHVFKGTISLLQNLSGNEDLYKIQNETRSHVFKGTISLLQNLSGNEDLYKIQFSTRGCTQGTPIEAPRPWMYKSMSTPLGCPEPI